ncbi:reverse transcriptase domain-containing protein [Tanacetum coccineum]
MQTRTILKINSTFIDIVKDLKTQGVIHDPREPHFVALKRILRYVHGTLDYWLQLFSSSTTDLVAYSDADWVEAEYRGVANAVAGTYWLWNLLREMHTPLSSTTLVYCDNISAVYLSCNPVQHQRTKHIEIDIHFVHDLVAAGKLAMPSHFRKKFRWGTAFATGLKHFTEPETGLRMKRTNRRTRVPIGLYPCHIKEKMTIKEVKGESVMEWKTKVTTKEGVVIQFPRKFRGYKLTSEEEVEENERLKEVWEKMGYVISDSDSDLESTAKASPKPNPDIATIIAHQLQNIIPQIVTQVTANVNNENGGNGNGGNDGCSYKTFTVCNPKEFDGKGGAVALTRWIEKMESVFENSGCTANQRVRYAASCFVNKALTWWNTQVQARGREAAIGMSWNDFKALLAEEFCPSNKMEKLENEFWSHTMVGANHVAYTDRFHELAKLVPHLVTPES